jgi:4-hydroxy-3-methylbut-2-en-1-yl diphosphate reductase
MGEIRDCPGGPSTLCLDVSPPSTKRVAPAERPPINPTGPSRVLLAAPRGYCAGVDRAVETVEHALDLYGEPVYVRKEIVHNKHVVEQLQRRGAIFVEETAEIPEGEKVVFSAHGVAPSVHENAAKRQLRTIDATCPLVTKVHVEARKFAEQGYTVILIGHEGHEEVEGTMGEAPANTVLVQTEAEVETLEVADPDRTAYITQTTLSVDETTVIIEALKKKFPKITGPKTDDICYATTNRQMAVKDLARKCELVLVIGSINSSNSNRLVEVARELGARSHLIDNHLQVDEAWLNGVKTVGITSGASAPEELVERLVTYFRDRGASEVSELRTVDEDVRFMLPSAIRRDLAAASG